MKKGLCEIEIPQKHPLNLKGRYPINIGLQNGALFPLTPTGIDPQFTLLPQELKR